MMWITMFLRYLIYPSARMAFWFYIVANWQDYKSLYYVFQSFALRILWTMALEKLFVIHLQFSYKKKIYSAKHLNSLLLCVKLEIHSEKIIFIFHFCLWNDVETYRNFINNYSVFRWRRRWSISNHWFYWQRISYSHFWWWVSEKTSGDTKQETGQHWRRARKGRKRHSNGKWKIQYKISTSIWHNKTY